MKLNKISSALRVNKTIKKRGKAALVTSAFLTLLNAAAYAEEAPQTVSAESDVAVNSNPDDDGRAIEVVNDSGEVEVIEVRGMRGTMTRSLSEKKNNTAIVDAIAAADFGDLPGLSLSDVIENISGASGHRLKGSQNEISIRGLGSYWGYATFNGRTITNAGEGRAVNFKKFPSDLVDKVTIYKSQQANLVEGGTSGTIEVGSVRAVDYGKSKTSVEVTGIYNDYYNEGDNQSEWGNKLTFSTIQNFETENLGAMGFSLGYVRSDSANPEENYGTSSSMAACSFRAADGSPLTTGNGVTERCGDGDLDSNGLPDNDTMVSPGRTDEPVTLGPNADASKYGVNGADHLAKFDPDSIFYVPDDSYWRTGEDTDERENIVGTFQWVPNETWNINFDYAYSHLEYTENRMELAQERGKNLNPDTLIIDDKGNLLYEEGEGKLTLQGENRNQVDTFNGYGLNVEFTPNDNLLLIADASYNRSYRYRLRHRAKFRNETQTAYSLDSTGTVPQLHLGDSLALADANFFYENVDGNLVENPNFGGVAFDVSDMASFVADDGGAYLEYGRENDERKDDMWAVRFDGKYSFDDYSVFSSFEAGIRYSNQHLYDYSGIQTALHVDTGTRRPIDANWNSDDHIDRGGVDDNDNAGDDWSRNDIAGHAEATARAQACGDNGHSLEGFMGASGGAADAGNFLTFDSKCLIGAYLGQVGYATPEGNNPDVGFYDIGENPDQRDGQLVDVTEKVTAIYAMANIDSEIAGIPVTGNLGLRYVRTETDSKSWGERPVLTETILDVDDPETTEINEAGLSTWGYTAETTQLYLDDSYDEWLPSLNLSFHLSDEWLLRTAAYRSLSRFSLNAMSAGQTISVCNDEDDNYCSYDQKIAAGTAQGNMMNPYTANNFDLSLEWYPSLDMAITLAGYWKDFTGGTELITEYRAPSITVNYDDGTTDENVLYNEIPYNVNQVADTQSTIKGMELTFQKHFSELPGVLSGIGVKGAWNHAISDFNTIEPANWGISPDANLFGFSKNVASASVYWEGDDLSMRLMYKYRSRYFQPNNQPFPDKAHRWVEDSDYVDAAVKYKINKHFEVSLKALNLLEEPQIMTRGTGTVSDYSYSGRKFFLSVKAKF
ncbi:TonB-dependent receptor [Colwellia sp. E2M01]|uniref:TonB-dependent receptor n=1 Tax=Colwellia sp. E2M01 TaxID=2841561 RepID=UPI001C099228|nr:TonB-dependent receptor [Colwellia sp. E2M01]MBU2869465.1 TonB-dependent receptor [Colwellia sp. E2M01]